VKAILKFPGNKEQKNKTKQTKTNKQKPQTKQNKKRTKANSNQNQSPQIFPLLFLQITCLS